MKLIPSIPQETDNVTSDFDNIVENAKDCGILFILLLVDRFKFRRFGYGLRTVRTCKDGKAQERQVSKAFKLFLT